MTPIIEARQIVCRMPTWLGDVVMATPALRALRTSFPDAHLVLQLRPHLLPLLEGSGLYDEVIPAHTGKGSVAANIVALRGAAADLGIIFPHSFRAAWEMARAGVARRVGYSREGRGWLLTHSLTPHRRRGKILPVPMVRQYLELVAAIGAVGDDRGPELGIPNSVREAGHARLAALGVRNGERIVAFNPGASFGPSKIWPLDYVARAADLFQRRAGMRPLLLCGPGEEPLAARIAELMETPALNTADEPLRLDVLKVALARASLLVTTDAGPRHVATALETPTLVLMGPTDPRYTDSHLGRTIVLRRELPCSPCHLKVCPIDHRCMRWISPEEVFAAGLRLLEAVTE